MQRSAVGSSQKTEVGGGRWKGSVIRKMEASFEFGSCLPWQATTDILWSIVKIVRCKTTTGTFSASDGHRRGSIRVDAKYPWHFIWEGSGEHYFFNGTTAYWLMGWQRDEVIRVVH